MDVVAAILSFLVLALIIETITNIIKGIVQVEAIGKVKLAPIIALIVGVLVAVFCRADIFAAVGFPMVSLMVAYIMTGILISGGATIIYELVSKLRESRASVQLTLAAMNKDSSEAETKMPTTTDPGGTGP